MKSFFFSFLIALLFVQHSDAQIFQYRQYTTANEGLVNSTVQDMMQDIEGYLWFATNNGLSRFDGSKFNHYSIEHGLSSNTLNSLESTVDGEILVGTKKNGIFTFNDGKFIPIYFDKNFILNNHTLICLNETLYSLNKTESLFALNLKDTSQLVQVVFPENVFPLTIYKTKHNEILAGTNNGVYKIENNQAIKNMDHFSYPVYSISENNDSIYLGSEGVIFSVFQNEIIKSESIQPNLKGSISHILQIETATWISTSQPNELFIKDQFGLISQQARLQLATAEINDILSDNEGNIWMATEGKGVFCFHHLFSRNFIEYDGLHCPFISQIELMPNQSILVGTKNGNYIFYENKFKILPSSIKLNEEIISVSSFQTTIHICTKYNGDDYLIDINGIRYQVKLHHSNFYYQVNDSMAISSKWNNKLYLHHLKSNHLDSIQLNKNVNGSTYVNAIFVESDTTLLVGTSNGLFKMSAHETGYSIKSIDIKSEIFAIEKDKNNAIWIGSSNGVAQYKDGNVNYQWSKNAQLLSNATSIKFDHSDRIWIGTLTGLFVVDKMNFILIDTRSGLLSDEVSSLEFDSALNVIWVGTNAGLTKIEIDAFDALNSFPVSIIFKNIRTQDGISKVGKDTTLSYNRNNFTLRFSGIHFTNPLAVNFYFQIDGSEWQKSNGRQMEFARLPYGKHLITMRAENDRGLFGPISTFEITIETPYWATWWFKTIVALLVFGIIFILIRWRFLYEKRKQNQALELQNKISELRHQALNASMNPHFIFNSLNSIQQFINAANTEEASEYLGKFARLIRLQLNNGNKTFIKLDEELDRMHRYLELEKIRFGNKLNYQITIDENIKMLDIEIPNMILQPFVENAIWHGILPLTENGKIHISFSRKNEILQVLIDDNGIGIKANESRKKNDHKSMGMQMIIERIQLLKQLNGKEIKIKILDKADLDKNTQGTIIQIEIPI